MRTLAVLGSTGSIGTQTLDVVRSQPDQHEVVALAAGRSIDLLREPPAAHPHVSAEASPAY